eukprot:5636856-Amphidinium_carterae.1
MGTAQCEALCPSRASPDHRPELLCQNYATGPYYFLAASKHEGYRWKARLEMVCPSKLQGVTCREDKQRIDIVQTLNLLFCFGAPKPGQ